MGVLRRLIATYDEAEDMINIGAYVKGTNPGIDEAIAKHQAVEAFLTQMVDEKAPILDTLKKLGDIAGFTIPLAEISAFAETETNLRFTARSGDAFVMDLSQAETAEAAAEAEAFRAAGDAPAETPK